MADSSAFCALWRITLLSLGSFDNDVAPAKLGSIAAMQIRFISFVKEVEMKRLILGLLLVVCLLSFACGPPAPAEEELAAATGPSETRLSLGQSATLEGHILFTVRQWQFTEKYIAGDLVYYGQERYPAEWAKFLWVYVKVKNVGEVPEFLPWDIILSYKDYTFREKVTLGVKDCTYSGFMTRLGPGDSEEGCLLFEVPREIDMSQAKLVVNNEVSWNLK